MRDVTMRRRARNPLLPQLLWGPQKRKHRGITNVAVLRVPAQPAIYGRTIEDLLLAAGLTCGICLYLLLLY